MDSIFTMACWSLAGAKDDSGAEAFADYQRFSHTFPAEKRVLDGVLSFRHATQHAIGDTEEQRAVL
jgi:hypothetical protein